MRGMAHQPLQSASAMIELLESRTLLSADWVGTWQVSGVDLTMRSLPSKGALAVTSPALTASISQVDASTYVATLSTKVGKQVRTEEHILTADGNGLFVDDPTGIETAPNGETIYSKLYIRMMMVDADVRMFDMTSVGYTSSGDTQRIQWINIYAGFASRRTLQVVKFPYDGSYTFHGFTMDVNRTSAGVLSVDQYYNDTTDLAFARTRGKLYAVSVDGNSPTTFKDGAGRLSQIVAGPVQGGGYTDTVQMYYRGPDGRLYYRAGGMVANTDPTRTDALGTMPAGQILNGWTTAGYSDVAPYNFAPLLAPSAGVVLNSVNQNQTDSQGTSVHEILDASNITDWNSGNGRGIAITSLNSSKGSWEYSTDGGVTWLPTGKVSAGRSLLLADSDQNRIRFIPKSNTSGALAKVMRLRAWDQTFGANGTFVSSGRAGNLTAFSAVYNYAGLLVAALPAPVVTPVFSDVPLAMQ